MAPAKGPSCTEIGVARKAAFPSGLVQILDKAYNSRKGSALWCLMIASLASWCCRLSWAAAISLAVAFPASAGNPQTFANKRVLLVIFAASGQEEIAAAILVSIAIEEFCCPEPCQLVEQYRAPFNPRQQKITQPINTRALARWFSGPISPATVELYRRVVSAEWGISANEAAVVQTLFRRYSAKVKKDKMAESRQSAYLQRSIAAAAEAKRKANGAWTALSDRLKRSAVEIKPPSDFEPLINEVKSHGFPPSLIAKATAVGATAQMIENARAHMFDPPIVAATAPVTFEDIVKLVFQINEDNEGIANCMCAEPN